MTEKSVGGRNKNNRACACTRTTAKIGWKAVKENMSVEFYSRNLFSETFFWSVCARGKTESRKSCELEKKREKKQQHEKEIEEAKEFLPTKHNKIII